MAHAALARTKINTEVTQPGRSRGTRSPAGPRKAGRPPRGPRVIGEARESARHPDRPVIELEFGILVYPPEADGEPWRATFTENGQRKYRQGATEEKLAAGLPVHLAHCGFSRMSLSQPDLPMTGCVYGIQDAGRHIQSCGMRLSVAE